MKSTFLSLLTLLVLVYVTSCSAPKSTESTSEPTEDSVIVDEPQTSKTIMVVTHRVAAFDAWYASYSKGDSMRSAGGLLKDFVYRSLEDSSTVTVAAYTRNHESAKAFASHEGLKKAMEEAGVISKPSISYWDVKWTTENLEMPELAGYLMVGHGVEDYAIWEKMFMDDDSARRANGIFAIQTALDADSVNNVGMFFGIEDFEKMNAFMASDDLKAKMAVAGVLGEPVVIPVTQVR